MHEPTAKIVIASRPQADTGQIPFRKATLQPRGPVPEDS